RFLPERHRRAHPTWRNQQEWESLSMFFIVQLDISTGEHWHGAASSLCCNLASKCLHFRLAREPLRADLPKAIARCRWIFGRASKTLGDLHPVCSCCANDFQCRVCNVACLCHHLTEFDRASLDKVMRLRLAPLPQRS